MDLQRIYSYEKESEKEIEQRIKVCRKQMENTINGMARQDLREEIRYLKEILDKRRNTKPKKVNRIKNAPTVAEHKNAQPSAFHNNKYYI